MGKRHFSYTESYTDRQKEGAMKPQGTASHLLDELKSRLCAYGALLCLMGFVGCAEASASYQAAISPLAFWLLGLSCALLCGGALFFRLRLSRQQAPAMASNDAPALDPLALLTLEELLEGSLDTSEPTFDAASFFQQLLQSAEPLTFLKDALGDIRTREAQADGLFENPGHLSAPTVYERFLAQELEDAKLLEVAGHPIPLRFVPQATRHLLGYHVDMAAYPFSYEVAAQRLTAALNRLLMVHHHFKNTPSPTLDQLYQAASYLEAMPQRQLRELIDPDAQGGTRHEWDTRHAIAWGLERLRTPYPFEPQFRLNLQAGLAAFAISATDPEVMASHRWSFDLDRRVPATTSMRTQASLDLCCKEALTCAKLAFALCPELSWVWVEGYVDNPQGHSCLLWAKLSRQQLHEARLSSCPDGIDLFCRLGGTVGWDGVQSVPIDAGFSLEDPQLSPAWRTQRPEYSCREIPATYQGLLKAQEVADLSIDESQLRSSLMEQILPTLGPRCQDAVAQVLALGGPDPEPAEAQARTRVAQHLVEGRLDAADGWEVLADFVSPDPVEQVLGQAMSRLGQEGVQATVARLSRQLKEHQASLAAAVDDGRPWHCFTNYAERSLYNHFYGAQEPTPHLAPLSHLHGQLALSLLESQQGHHDQALLWALNARDLDPLYPAAQLQVARVYMELGDSAMAAQTLRDLLASTYDAGAAAQAYHLLSSVAMTLEDTELAVASLAMATTYPTPVAALSALFLSGLVASIEDPDEAGRMILETPRILESHQVPKAPTQEVLDALRQGAQAATNAEIFSVATDLTALLAQLESDQVLHSISKSMAL